MRDYRQSPSFWPFKADWFWSVKFVSRSKSIKCILWDSFSYWAVIAVIGKLQRIFITSKRKPNLEGFVCSFLSITGLRSLGQFAPKCSFLESKPLEHCSFRISWQIPVSTTVAQTSWLNSLVRLCDEVRPCGAPNVFRAWPQVYSGFKIAFWYQYLEHYEDKIVVDFLRYGWPINFHSEVFPISTVCNHPSTTSVAIWGLIAIQYSTRTNKVSFHCSKYIR